MSEDYSGRYRKYALGLLLLGYIVNFVDRSILSILLEPIKLDFQLSDSELGLLGGLAFALFYATLGIPIAALADRWSRVKVLAISMVIWSAMTALCGLATNFVTLLLARIGVGVGEAGASPPSHSLIADYFPVETRATALSIYALGVPLGNMIGNYVGGWGADEFGWRMTFFLVGIPGIFVALLIWLGLREPPRGMADIGAQAIHLQEEAPVPSMREVAAFLGKKVSFIHIGFGAGLHAFVSYGVGTWNAPFLIRLHEMPLTEVGSWLAIISGAGAIGTFAGGYLADKMFDKTGERRWYLWVPGLSTLLLVPLQLSAYLSEDKSVALASLFAAATIGLMYLGPSFAMTQGLVSLRMRAVASAILLFLINLIGMGLGPYFVGIASDLLEPTYGTASLRYALCLCLLANLWAAGHYFIGARHLRRDLEETEILIHQQESAI